MAQHQQSLAQQRQQLIQAAQQQAQAVAHAQQQQAVQQAQQAAAAAAAAQQQQLASRNSFKELMKAKHAAAAAVLNEDYLNNNANSINNNNNNTHANNANLNNNLSSMNNNNLQQFGVHQINPSKKMLDSQKYQKYYSKRKLVQQYEQEMRAEKRKLGIEDVIQAAAAAKALNLRLNNGGMTSPVSVVAPSTPTPNPPETPTNGHSSGTDEEQPPLIHNIKSEPNYDEDEGMEVDQEHHSSPNNNNNNTSMNNNNNNNNNHEEDYYSQRDSVIGKSIKHSILEPNIVLKQSDECLSTNNQTGSLNLCKNVS